MLLRTHRGLGRPPFETVALVLQGGGALGAYQGGVYEALAEAGIAPDWVAGISIGAINAALIAGNAPEDRVDRLRAFWEAVTLPFAGAFGDLPERPSGAGPATGRGEGWRRLANGGSALAALLGGAAGFFAPRLPSPWFQPSGSPEATSYYDTAALRGTLERYVDFDRINRGGTRLSLGAVNVRTGNFVAFDTATHVIGPEHVMASGALPPGFPAVEIDGEHYWDGGLVSNTPLQWVLEDHPRRDTLAFQVDLWSAVGELPRNLPDVAMRQKEIQYSSRTRLNTDQFKRMQRLRAAANALLRRMPAELRDSEEGRLVADAASEKVFRIVHFIYRSRHDEADSKDYDFSRLSMRDHWRSGYLDAARSLRHTEALERPSEPGGVATFDLARDART